MNTKQTNLNIRQSELLQEFQSICFSKLAVAQQKSIVDITYNLFLLQQVSGEKRHYKTKLKNSRKN